MPPVPIVFLKTRSDPHDSYEDYFSASERAHPVLLASVEPAYHTVFIPTLEHRLHDKNLRTIEDMLTGRVLSERYGGMIFTSSRAVEAFAGLVKKEEERLASLVASGGMVCPPLSYAIATPLTKMLSKDTDKVGPLRSGRGTAIVMETFPLYAVGPATAKQLTTLHHSAPLTFRSPFPACSIEGAHTGSGAALAAYILHSYNALHENLLFEFYEAPRLPFVPLLSDSSAQYSRRRLDADDPRLSKKPLLFLVGETRRDVVPRTLQTAKPEAERIQVDEFEVYRTELAPGFHDELETQIAMLEQQNLATGAAPVIVVVVFSPQACESMLRALNLIGPASPAPWSTKFVVVTIGPTTRDHLRDAYGFHANVCAETPSPRGVEEAVLAFFRKEKQIQDGEKEQVVSVKENTPV